MKKYLLFVCCMSFVFAANAQMADLIGGLTVDGALTSSSISGVGQMQDALSKVQLQQDLSELNMEIQTKYMGNYSQLNKSDLNFTGLNGLSWNVVPVSAFEYYVELFNVNSSLCHALKYNPAGSKRTKINSGNDCKNSDNTIKLFY